MRLTRLAPSPTGALHLGNVRTFLINWLLARQNGWEILLRIEDLDGPRIKQGADLQAIQDLQWLGFDWDRGPVHQSNRLPLYAQTTQRLIDAGQAYPCVCSRKEVESAASAPHAEDGAAVYPETCRDRFKTIDEARQASGREPAIRFRVLDGPVEFLDGFADRQVFDVRRQLGDFVIAKADGTPAYQLAVVIDDAAMGITDIVRGDDLIDSTPRQILLYRALGLPEEIQRYYHLPLVVGPDGRRLAKRHGDTRISFYRERGVPSSNLLRLLARWIGIPESAAFDTPRDLLPHFRLDLVPRRPIVFSDEDGRTFEPQLR